MSLCCNTPYLTRIEKIKENRSSAGTQNQSAKASYVKAQNQGAVPSPNASLKSTIRSFLRAIRKLLITLHFSTFTASIAHRSAAM